VYDEAGESHQITERYLIGTYEGLLATVEQAVDTWQQETGLAVERIEWESHGRIDA
jgi:hypothetical protein